ncbi:ribonuclease HI, partial [Klebsiella pneumoniae]|nr:ribonuclease HI [Klebsiella pneumoniae]
MVSVSRTIWRVIAVLIAVIYVRLVVLQFDSITGSLPEMLKQVEIFTDGSCLGNPGPVSYTHLRA